MKKYVFESLKFFCAAILCTILSAFTTPARAALPSGYTELEYIESTGTQWIDTGIMPTAKLKIESRVGIITDNASIFGSGTTSENRTQLYTYQQKINLRAWSSENKAIIPYTAGEVYIITVDFLNKKLTLNDTSVDFTYDVNSAINYPIYINEINLAGSANRTAGKQAYYSFKMWENNTLVRDLIPAKRNSDGAVGMYDTVTRTFFANAGTGEFIAGPAIGNLVDVSSAYASYGTYVQNNDTFVYTPDASTNDQKGLAFKAPVTDGHKIFISCNYSIEGSDSYRVGLAKNSSLGYFSSAADVITTGTNKTFSGIVTAVADRSGFLGFRTDATSGSLSVKNIQVYDLTAIFGEGNEPDAAGAYAYFNSIKIATTKYNETAFGPLNTALANAISVVDSVVSNTITQAASIATLQAQKQTRPNDIADDNEKCPAGKKCLLVEDASGVPHWYEIVERYSRLPDGYTELQWIESTGTQYIDTGLNPKPDVTSVEFELAITDTSTEQIFGARQTSSATAGSYNIFANVSPNQFRLDWVGNSFTNVNDIVLGTFYKFVLNADGSVDFNNLHFGRAETKTECNYNMYLFGANSAGVYTENSLGKVRYKGAVKIKERGTLVRDFIPAKNSSGVVGMYDTVSGQFFTNQGTGEFIAGDPVSE